LSLTSLIHDSLTRKNVSQFDLISYVKML
jgi:hypothetical protein